MALVSIDRLVGIRQEISAGNNFDETEPAGSPTFVDGIYKFAAETAGGLFDTASSKYGFKKGCAVDLIGIEIVLGGQTAWAINKTDIDGNTVELYSGTTETEVVKLDADRIALLYGDTVSITTTGASTAMVALLKFEPHVPKRQL